MVSETPEDAKIVAMFEIASQDGTMGQLSKLHASIRELALHLGYDFEDMKRTREEAKAAQQALDAAQKAKEATRREEAGPTPDGSPAVSYGAQESKAYDEAQRSYQDAQKAAKEAKEKARTFNERSGYNQPSPQFGNSTPADIALRYKAKAEENALPFDMSPNILSRPSSTPPSPSKFATPPPATDNGLGTVS
jgi:hypothetical protein